MISSSPTDVQPVFDAIGQSAAPCARGRNVGVVLRRRRRSHVVARGARQAAVRRVLRARSRARPGDSVNLDARSPSARRSASRYLRSRGARGLGRATSHRRAGVAAVLAVPLCGKAKSIGAITCRRLEPGPFTEKQVALLQTFADQAVIAIENVRLFNETQGRRWSSRPPSAEVLRVISELARRREAGPRRDGSRRATRLCEAGTRRHLRAGRRRRMRRTAFHRRRQELLGRRAFRMLRRNRARAARSVERHGRSTRRPRAPGRCGLPVSRSSRRDSDRHAGDARRAAAARRPALRGVGRAADARPRPFTEK